MSYASKEYTKSMGRQAREIPVTLEAHAPWQVICKQLALEACGRAPALPAAIGTAAC